MYPPLRTIVLRGRALEIGQVSYLRKETGESLLTSYLWWLRLENQWPVGLRMHRPTDQPTERVARMLAAVTDWHSLSE